MKIIQQILSLEIFQQQPPVLIDIGASGEINTKWKSIAPYSICMAFDADDREFAVNENISSGYKNLLTVNRIVTAQPMPVASFYLTKSPFCSSLLQPEMEKLEPWSFRSLFTVEKKIELPATTIEQAMTLGKIAYIDWFKTDTQGTDLRLFMSLTDEVKNNILAAEFEPGIMDAYAGEDKLFSVMQTLPQQGFWLSSLDVKGTQRLHEIYQQQFGAFNAHRIVRKSPCWTELTYLRQPSLTNERQYLLLFVFALLERQYGFALEICDKANEQYKTVIWNDCRNAVLQQLKKEKLKLPLVILKKQFNKLFANINA